MIGKEMRPAVALRHVSAGRNAAPGRTFSSRAPALLKPSEQIPKRIFGEERPMMTLKKSMRTGKSLVTLSVFAAVFAGAGACSNDDGTLPATVSSPREGVRKSGVARSEAAQGPQTQTQTGTGTGAASAGAAGARESSGDGHAVVRQAAKTAPVADAAHSDLGLVACQGENEYASSDGASSAESSVRCAQQHPSRAPAP